FSVDSISASFASPAIAVQKFVNGQPDTACPEVVVGSTVTYTYLVTNPGDLPLANVTLTDVPTPDSGQPAPVLSGGFNVGDTNLDGLLDTTEVWQFTASSTAQVGMHTNVVTASGQGAIVSEAGTVLTQPVTATDNGCYHGNPASPAITTTASPGGVV